MKIDRLFEIVHILLNKETTTANDLAKRFNVSTRTIYRDMDTLSCSGIPIYMNKGHNGGISLLDGYVLNKAVLSKEEISELISSVYAINEINKFDSQKVLSKLGDMFGENQANWIQVDFSGWYNQKETAEIFSFLKQAILKKTVVEFTYFSESTGCSSRRVEPIKLVFKGGGWYLFAFCKKRLSTRFFKLTRMKQIELLNEHFTTYYNEELDLQTQVFKDDFVNLKLKISSCMAHRVYDEFDWNLIEKDGDGNFLVTTNMPKGRWIYSYVSSFGPNCIILEPKNIREEFKKEMEKIINNYL